MNYKEILDYIINNWNSPISLKGSNDTNELCLNFIKTNDTYDIDISKGLGENKRTIYSKIFSQSSEEVWLYVIRDLIFAGIVKNIEIRNEFNKLKI